MTSMPRRPGRPAQLPREGTTVAMTFRLPASLKVHLMEQSAALDMTLNEYMISLLERDR